MSMENHNAERRQNWRTPPWIIQGLGPFDLDVAADPDNAVAPRFYTEADDGLSQPWDAERVWCNPPFAKPFPWLRAAWLGVCARRFRRAYVLLPAGVGTGWFAYAADVSSVFFFEKRVRFCLPDGTEGPSPPTGHILCRFGPEPNGFRPLLLNKQNIHLVRGTE